MNLPNPEHFNTPVFWIEGLGSILSYVDEQESSTTSSGSKTEMFRRPRVRMTRKTEFYAWKVVADTELFEVQNNFEFAYIPKSTG